MNKKQLLEAYNKAKKQNDIHAMLRVLEIAHASQVDLNAE